jgi:hypothetical protein
VTLLIKKDDNRRFCGDYQLLNLQTKKDAFPRPLMDDVFEANGEFNFFPILNLHYNFCQVKMASKDVKKSIDH